ncbi:MAG TPA: protein translocase subunit SecD [Acidimicrobiales bacterium]|nr:protein translocase subunit SecD [Acidimicrobiales bacterium]
MKQRSLLVSVLLTLLVCFGTFAGVLAAHWKPVLGLDLRGGLSVTYTPKPLPGQKVTNAELQDAVQVMSDRVNALGVSQPNISTQGSNIVVQLPGVKNASEILKIVGTTAQLFFRPVIAGAPAYTPPAKTKPVYRIPPSPATTYAWTAQYDTGSGSSLSLDVPPAYLEDPIYTTYVSTPPAQDALYEHDNIILNEDCNGATRCVLGPSQATGTIIKSAYAQDTSSGWVVVFNLTGSGSPIFNDIARKYYGTLVANDLDGAIVSAPIIEATSFNGSGQISGNFDSSSANKLALELNYGALPVALTPLTSQVVSPSLGAASLHAGLLAGLLGLLLVMGYTIFYYRALGVVVVLGLLSTAGLLYAIISTLGHKEGLTLDLSGITGLIVSVGITVDSYVVYFERLKDEIRAGRSIRSSVDRGFRSAYRTILSADAVSFIGAAVLYLLSIGAVKGFALMLGIATLLDVVTAYTFTRPLVILLGRNRVFTEARGLGVARGLAVSPTAEAA